MNFYKELKMYADEAGIEGVRIVEVPLELRPTKDDCKELERRIAIRAAETDNMLDQSKINAQLSLLVL